MKCAKCGAVVNSADPNLVPLCGLTCFVHFEKWCLSKGKNPYYSNGATIQERMVSLDEWLESCQ